MTPTSLDVASFAPAEGNLSSQTSSFGSRSQDRANDGSSQGATFRQVMSSYNSSHEDHHTEETRQREARNGGQNARMNDAAPRLSGTDGAAGSSGTGAARGNRTQAADAAASSVPTSNTSNTGADSAAKTAAESGGEGILAQSSSEASGASLSPMQMLLRGASLTTASHMTASLTGGSLIGGSLTGGPLTGGPLRANFSIGAATQPTETAAESLAAMAAKAGGTNAQPLAAKPILPGQAFPVGAKADKSKTDATGVREGAAANGSPADAGNLGVVAAQLIANGSEANGGPSTKTADVSGAVAGDHIPQQLDAEAVGRSGNAKPAANNFAFAVRLPGEAAAQAASASTESNSPATHGALGLETSAQPGLGIAAAGEADTSPGGNAGGHAGQHAGQADAGQNPDALVGAAMLVNEAGATAAQSAHSNSSAPVSDTTVTATEPDAAPDMQGQPVRNLHLQLTGENNQRVDIRLVEVAGEMRVSVRAGDTKLADTLQDHIPDLAKNLDQQHIRADIWSPRTESAGASNGANPGGDSSRGGEPRGNNGGNNGGGQQRQGNGRQQQNQPEWVDELENYSSWTTTTTRSN